MKTKEQMEKPILHCDGINIIKIVDASVIITDHNTQWYGKLMIENGRIFNRDDMLEFLTDDGKVLVPRHAVVSLRIYDTERVAEDDGKRTHKKTK